MSGLRHPSVALGVFPKSRGELLKGKPHVQKLGPVGLGLSRHQWVLADGPCPGLGAREG